MDERTSGSLEVLTNQRGSLTALDCQPNRPENSSLAQNGPLADTPVSEAQFSSFACKVAETTELQSRVNDAIVERLLALERAICNGDSPAIETPPDTVASLPPVPVPEEKPNCAPVAEPAAFAPNTALLEVTSHCNMHCIFCPSDDLTRPKQHVSDEAARKFIKAVPTLIPNLPHMWFHCMGEPLLNPRLFEYMDMCEELGIGMTLISNLTLLTEENLRKIYSHPHVNLVLSLHTPTDKSLAARGCTTIKSFDEYFQFAARTIEAKFKYGNRCILQICLATETFDNPECSGSPRLWTLFPDVDEYNNALQSFLHKLADVAAGITRKYAVQCDDEWPTALSYARPQFENGTATLDPGKLPGPAHGGRVGWMLLPNVFVSRKPFGLFPQPRFIQRRLPAGKLSFVEERIEPFVCSFGKTQVGLLSNGEFTTCCKDANGEMGIGNINTVEPLDFLRSRSLANLMTNFGLSKICRRCCGTVFVMDTEPLADTTQTIECFGSGFYAFEPELMQRGGRWMNGRANAYFYTRLDAWEICIDLFSPLPDGIKCELLVDRMTDPDNQSFSTEIRCQFEPKKNQESSLVLRVNLARNSLYRITLISPSIPYPGRPTGIAVFGAKLQGQPYNSIPVNTAPATKR